MADRMEFPKTIQEFMDGYSFKDDKEVYTNGSRLIPTFRVEQALEHYGQAIRNKAIDEFAEKLSNECFEQSMTVVFENRVRADVLTLDGVTEIIFQIAQQLKAGGTDGTSTTDN